MTRQLAWYLAAAISYIGLSIWHKILLSWILGPVWLVTVVVGGPALTAAFRQRTRR